MTLGRSKNNTSQITGKSFAPKQKNKLTLFSVIATKPVEIVFARTVDNIKWVLNLFYSINSFLKHNIYMFHIYHRKEGDCIFCFGVNIVPTI